VSGPQAASGSWASRASEPNDWQRLSDVPIEHVAGTFLGGRKAQEDSVGVLGTSRTQREAVFVVADGMGGEAGGARASGIVRDTVLGQYVTVRDGQLEPQHALAECVRIAHAEILRQQAEQPEFANMGSTVVACATDGHQIWIAHCGDSRLYEFRAGTLRALTKDHTRVQRMIDEGIVTPEVGAQLPDAHVLSHAVGRGDLRAEVKVTPAAGCDAILLCSDGLYGVVPDEILASVMRGFGADDGIRILMSLVAALQGSDNTSVVIARFKPPALPVDESLVFQATAEQLARPIAVRTKAGVEKTFTPRVRAVTEPAGLHLRRPDSVSGPSPALNRSKARLVINSVLLALVIGLAWMVATRSRRSVEQPEPVAAGDSAGSGGRSSSGEPTGSEVSSGAPGGSGDGSGNGSGDLDAAGSGAVKLTRCTDNSPCEPNEVCRDGACTRRERCAPDDRNCENVCQCPERERCVSQGKASMCKPLCENTCDDRSCTCAVGKECRAGRCESARAPNTPSDRGGTPAADADVSGDSDKTP
jgi:serine/threonine protein phosphatase PrpC